MGTITVTVVGDGSIGTRTKIYTLADADVNRMVAWAKIRYATVPTAAVPNPPALTTVQALVALFDGFIATTKQSVVDVERSVARQALVDPVPIVTT